MSLDPQQPPESPNSEPNPAESDVTPTIDAPEVLNPEFVQPTTGTEMAAERIPQPSVQPRSSSAQSQTFQKIEQTWREVQPVLKTQTVKVLRGTIQVLEGAVERLESTESTGESSSGTASSLEELPQKLSEIWQRIQTWWAGVLPQVRSRLPEALNQLSDRALTGAIVAALVILLWFISGLFSGKPKPTPVAVRPTPVKVTPVKVAPSPTVAPVPPVLTTPVITPTPTPAPVVLTPAPPVREVPSVSVMPVPPITKLELTPEQKLNAAIQNQVADISDRYVDGLIRTVQANPRRSRLVIKVRNEWYGLGQTQQDALANELLQRVRGLNFSKLELTDTEGVLIGRSPVVGSEMIIFKRSQEPEV